LLNYVDLDIFGEQIINAPQIANNTMLCYSFVEQFVKILIQKQVQLNCFVVENSMCRENFQKKNSRNGQ